MDNSHLFLSSLLLIAMIMIGILIYRYFSLVKQLPLLIQDEFDDWRQKAEIEMKENIRACFQEWRDEELQAIIANAREEALTTAHNLFKNWREHELETIKREQREIATREAKSQLIKWKSERERSVRQGGIVRTPAVADGKLNGPLIPVLPNFHYNPKDTRFIGSPVDFVVFDGLNNGDGNHICEIVFVEIKSRTSDLARSEKLVKDAINAGRVKWVEYSANYDLQQLTKRAFE